MPLPVIANAVRVTLNWRSDAGPQAHNVMHFQSPANLLDDLWDALEANVSDDLWGQTVTTVNVETVDLLPLDGVSATVTETPTTVADWTGTATGEFGVALAAVVRLKTGLQGRRHRGRVFLPFVAESRQSAGILSGTTAADLQAAWEAFRVAMNADGFPLLVASYVGTEINDVTSIEVPTILGTMRRRQDALR